jgi:opacity protein-like surface antigen
MPPTKILKEMDEVWYKDRDYITWEEQVMRSKFFIVSLILAISLGVPAGRAFGEVFLDAYIGPAFTSDGKFNNGPNVPATTKFDTVVSGGARIGYFFIPYIGFAVDLSHYQPDGEFGGGGSGFSFDSRVTGLSFDLMGRLPLMVSNNFPNGQLQPYLAVGPGVYFSHIKISPSPVFGSKDSDSSAGIKVAAGSTWMFTRNIGLFGEYRFSHFTADLLGFEQDVNTHRLQVGATFRF